MFNPPKRHEIPAKSLISTLWVVFEKTITSNVQVAEIEAGSQVVITILFLTFEDSAGTAKLSETFRLWFEKVGIQTDYHSFRSNAHIVAYFVLGVVLSLFGRERGWRWWIVGCGFGLIDESVKVLLPTREFDVVDLIKDWVGVAAGVGVMKLTRKC